MEETDIISKMFKKGDVLKATKYKDFKLTDTSPEQLKYLRKLTFFSKHREWIINRFDTRKVTQDIKVHFLDLHSMKLGDSVFYDLESKRQDYLSAVESWPYLSGILGIGVFCVYAIKKPIYNKLYKEIFYSLGIGAGLSYSYVYYMKYWYMKKVNEVYDKLKLKMQANPRLAEMKEDAHIIKNFGFHKFQDLDLMDEEDLDDESGQEPGIFDGTVEQERQDTKRRVLKILYQE